MFIVSCTGSVSKKKTKPSKKKTKTPSKQKTQKPSKKTPKKTGDKYYDSCWPEWVCVPVDSRNVAIKGWSQYLNAMNVKE